MSIGTQLATRRRITAAVLFTVLLWPGSAGAQELYNYTVSLMGGLAGSTDVDPGDGIESLNLQLGASWVIEPRVHLGLRVGRFDLDADDRFGRLVDAELTYATLGGEYRSRERFYESGVYLAVGAYQLDGRRLDGTGGSDETVGLALGVTGEFKINERFSIPVELSGHYADFDDASVFVMGLVGVRAHFR